MKRSLSSRSCLILLTLGTLLLTPISFAAAPPVPGLDIRVNEGADAGPTLFATIGLDGNRDAYAPALAKELSEWPLTRGRLIFAVINDEARSSGDDAVKLTRAFPVKKEREQPIGKTATALWELAGEADYILDLRESRGSRQTNAKAYGQTIIHVDSLEAKETATQIAHAMDYDIPDPHRQWISASGGLVDMLAFSSHSLMGKESMTIYFSSDLLKPQERERLAKLGIYRLLDKHRMLDVSDPRFETLNPKPRVPQYREMHPGKKLVGVFTGNGSGDRGITASLATFAESEKVVALRFTSEEVRDGILSQFDAVIFPGGSGRGQAAALGDEGRAKVTAFVQKGGGYIGICAGAYLALSGQAYGLNLINAKTKSPEWRRGGAVLPMELSDRGEEWYTGDRLVNVRYNQGPIFEPDTHPDLPPYEVLAYFRGEVAKNKTPVGIQKDSPAIAAGTCGAGRVVIISPHPESTSGAELGYFLTQSAARLFSRE